MKRCFKPSDVLKLGAFNMVAVLLATYGADFTLTGAWLSARIRFRVAAGTLPESSGDRTDRTDALIWAMIRTFLWPVSLPIIVTFALGDSIATQQLKKAAKIKEIEAIADRVISRRE